MFDAMPLTAPAGVVEVCAIRVFETPRCETVGRLQELAELIELRAELAEEIKTAPEKEVPELQKDLSRLDLEIALTRAMIPMGRVPKEWE